MPEYAFETLDVFTTTRFGGNPLAVLPNARGLDTATLQAIAREFALSETSFVLPPSDPAHTALLRIFTPAAELAFAGHPTVGTALALAAAMPTPPATLTFEMLAGLVTVMFEGDGPARTATLEAPQALTLGEAIPPETIAACAGLAAADVLTATHAPVVAGVGNPFVIAELAPGAVGRATPDLSAMREALRRHTVGRWGFPLYVHERTAAGRHVRMFNPLGGIAEDPATGSAAVALAALLLHASGEDALTLELGQGAELGRPSQLYTSARRTPEGIRASVGGAAVAVMRGMIEA